MTDDTFHRPLTDDERAAWRRIAEKGGWNAGERAMAEYQGPALTDAERKKLEYFAEKLKPPVLVPETIDRRPGAITWLPTCESHLALVLKGAVMSAPFWFILWMVVFW